MVVRRLGVLVPGVIEVALTEGRRSAETTLAHRDLSLVARRILVGTMLVGLAAVLALKVGGWAWVLAVLLAIPGAYTLAAVRQPYVAPCPACGSPLGADLVNLPDEPVLGDGAKDLRCDACGIYVDASGRSVREVPFSRKLEGPGYECALEATNLASLQWGTVCVSCGRDAARSLALSAREIGVLSGHEASLTQGVDGTQPPYCSEHGDADDPSSRALMVARSGRRVVVQFRLYTAYRSFLDVNRDHLDVRVKRAAVSAADPVDRQSS